MLGEIAVVAGEETLQALEVFVEGFEIFRTVAIGQGVELVRASVFAVFVVEFGAMFGDGEIEFGGMSRFEAADFPAGMDETVHEVRFELILGQEEIVVETGEDLETILGFCFQNNAGGIASMSGAVEGRARTASL